jgi:Winged helix DNA-binding domain
MTHAAALQASQPDDAGAARSGEAGRRAGGRPAGERRGISVSETLRRRLTAQQLTGPPARDPVEVARRLLAIQAQDGRGARLAVRARTRGVTSADIDRALTQERSLVLTWLHRGTLHLVASEDYRWLQALTTPPLLSASTRRLAQQGLPPALAERAVEVVRRALADDGPLTREALRDRLQRADVPVAGQALIHVLFRAAIEGVLVRGPMIGTRHAYVLVDDWLPAPPGPVDRSGALAELARRYLAGHGPAGERDLARWAGLPLRDARAGLSAIAGELRDEPGGLVDRRARLRMGRLPPPRLLGPWEPVLVGWSSRIPVLREHEARVVTGGLFRNFAMVGGRAVATWRLSDGAVTIESFAPVSDRDTRALREDAAAVSRFLARE